MEPSKKPLSLKKRWLKRLSRYKISNASTASTDSQSSDTSSQRNAADQHALDNRRNRGGVFGSLRRVHDRVKLCVSKHKVRTLDAIGNPNAFHSNQNLEVQHVNSTSVPDIIEVTSTETQAAPVSLTPTTHTNPDEAEYSISPMSHRSNQQCSSSLSLEEGNSGNALVKEISNLANCCWYWGPLTRREAEEKLSNLPDGSFLIRDSSTDKYLFCISFRSIGHTLHSHIDHITGYYSLFNTARYSSIAELVDHAIKASQDSLYCYTKPRDNAFPRFPVRLLHPVSRFTQVRSLQHLCRFVIRQTTSINNISRLPIPVSLQTYLKQGHY